MSRTSTVDQTLPYILYPQMVANGATSAPQQWWFFVPAGVPAFEFDVTVQASTQGISPPGLNTFGGDPSEIISTVAGSINNIGFQDGNAARARFNNYLFPAYDSGVGSSDPLAGNIFVGDSSNRTIRLINPAGQVFTIAGRPGNTVGDGIGLAAGFNGPQQIAFGPSETLYVADRAAIRRVVFTGGDPTNANNWSVSTIAGNLTKAGYTNGPGNTALFMSANGIVRDPSGALFVGDDNMVREVQYIGGLTASSTSYSVSLLAGSSTDASGSQDGVGTQAGFFTIVQLAEDTTGNIYVTDENNSTIREISPDASVVTIAGQAGNPGYQDGPSSVLVAPEGLAVDAAGYVYFSDEIFIRVISPKRFVSTLAGEETGGQVGDGPGNLFGFYYLHGLTLGPGDEILTGDSSAIRSIQKEITAGTSAKVAKVSSPAR